MGTDRQQDAEIDCDVQHVLGLHRYLDQRLDRPRAARPTIPPPPATITHHNDLTQHYEKQSWQAYPAPCCSGAR